MAATSNLFGIVALDKDLIKRLSTTQDEPAMPNSASFRRSAIT